MYSHDPNLCRNYRRFLEERCTDFAPSQNFCVVQPPRFPSFLPWGTLPHLPLLSFRGKLLACYQAYPCPFFFPFICSCAFKNCVQISFSFCTFLAALGPRNFLLFHHCVEHFMVCRDLFPLSFRFRVLSGVYGALSPAASRGLLPPGRLAAEEEGGGGGGGGGGGEGMRGGRQWLHRRGSRPEQITGRPGQSHAGQVGARPVNRR